MDPSRESIQLRGDPAELTAVREFVASWAQRSGLAEAATFRACLVATEAVSNAMRHGRGSDGANSRITVTCHTDGADLVVEVTDRGQFRSRRERADDNGGRGLFLIRELTRSFELNAGSDGTRLCMHVPAGAGVFAGSRAA